MSIENARDYLERLEDDIKCEGEEKEKVSCSALVYILGKFLEELGRE